MHLLNSPNNQDERDFRVSSPSNRPHRLRDVLLAIAVSFAIVAIMLGSIGFGGVKPAGGATIQPITPIGPELYQHYPPTLGCTDAVLEGLHVLTSSGQNGTSIESLYLKDTDVLTVQWTDFNEACSYLNNGMPFFNATLASHALGSIPFNPAINQPLVGFKPCAMGSCQLGYAEGFGLTMDIAAEFAKTDANCLQLDLVLGAPLETVGPDGDYYSGVNNKTQDMLVSWGTVCRSEPIPEIPEDTPATTVPDAPEVDTPTTVTWVDVPPWMTTTTGAPPVEDTPEDTVPPTMDTPTTTSTTQAAPPVTTTTTRVEIGQPLGPITPTSTTSTSAPVTSTTLTPIRPVTPSITALPVTGSPTIDMIWFAVKVVGVGVLFVLLAAAFNPHWFKSSLDRLQLAFASTKGDKMI